MYRFFIAVLLVLRTTK